MMDLHELPVQRKRTLVGGFGFGDILRCLLCLKVCGQQTVFQERSMLYDQFWLDNWLLTTLMNKYFLWSNSATLEHRKLNLKEEKKKEIRSSYSLRNLYNTKQLMEKQTKLDEETTTDLSLLHD